MRGFAIDLISGYVVAGSRVFRDARSLPMPTNKHQRHFLNDIRTHVEYPRLSKEPERQLRR